MMPLFAASGLSNIANYFYKPVVKSNQGVTQFEKERCHFEFALWRTRNLFINEQIDFSPLCGAEPSLEMTTRNDKMWL